MKNIILEIQKQFIEALQAKNSWGKNEVKELYLSISNKVMADTLEEREAMKLRKFAEHYGYEGKFSEIVDKGRMSSDLYKDDPTMGGQQIPKLDRKGRDKDPFPNSAHSFTEGSELPPLEDGSLCGKFPRVNPDYKGNPFINDGNGDKS